MEAEKEPKSILPDVKNEDSHEGYGNMVALSILVIGLIYSWVSICPI